MVYCMLFDFIILLSCIVLCCIVLDCIALHCIAWHGIALLCLISYHIILVLIRLDCCIVSSPYHSILYYILTSCDVREVQPGAVEGLNRHGYG